MQAPPTDPAARQRRLAEVERENAILQQQLAVQQFVSKYEVQLEWPAEVVTKNGLRNRTNADLIQHRLLEAGIVYDAPVTTGKVYEIANDFIRDLEASDCFHSVGVEIGRAPSDVPAPDASSPPRRLLVHLNEKNWYRLHAGAGLKADMFGTNSTSSYQQLATDAVMPPAELEVSAALRNLAGCLDTTEIQYKLDTFNIGAWKLSHKRPLYTILPGGLGAHLLDTSIGSQHTFHAQAALDTIDTDWISSYKLFQRYLSVEMATPKSLPGWASLEWFLGYRDMIPRRHPTMPFHLSASPEISRLAGPSLKHSITANLEYDAVQRDPVSQLPIDGLQIRWRTECAIPPGDVGFFKSHAACAVHWLVPNTPVAFHATGSVGYLHALHNMFPRVRPAATLPVDRFIAGGVGSLRGFAIGGVGPRSKGTAENRIGDALGGNFTYSATALVSTAPPFSITNDGTDPIRLFGFCTAGTCVGAGHLSTIMSSTRVVAGVGIRRQLGRF